MSRRKIARAKRNEYSDEDESYDERDDDDRVNPMIRNDTTVSTWMMARVKQLERDGASGNEIE